MTDTFRQAATHPVQDHRHAALNGVTPHPQYLHRTAQPTESTGEDDGQINCICGNNEDDGNTVACDGCNTWQHISCYYPNFGNSSLDDLDHWCVDCRPQTQVDRHAAFLAQQEAKARKHELQHNGAKRPTSTKAAVKVSHKKKVKDPAAGATTNGWPPERHSASPRDQPPPSKRPKTSHRASNSVAQASIAGQSRKRNGSSVQHRRSVSRTPDTIIPMYSEEFLQAYREDRYTVPSSNVAGVAIYEAFSAWVHNPEELAKVTTGGASDIFMRWYGPSEELYAQTEVEIIERVDPGFSTPDGRCATWKCLVAVTPLAEQACIGELKGHIQYSDEYKQDPMNRWSTLVHPEPFVFFHPQLPICIDARSEGTDMRYIRRSCQPNAKLKVIVTGSADYHFCFIATREIEPGDEITIEWEPAPPPSAHLIQAHDGSSTEITAGVLFWASTVLANCGPCECGHGRDICLMGRMDRRGEVISIKDVTKAPKAGVKRKKAGQHISPLNTHSVNSRSGSEVRKGDHDEEPSDSRSASDSVERDSASRDMTPNTHYSMNGVYEMSERERRKVAKEEELFHKQAEEGLGKQKKKRSSAGSTLNTPSATSSKQLHLPTATGSRHAETRPAALPSAKSANGRRPKPPPSVKQTSSKPFAKPAPPPRPIYVNAVVQCDMDADEMAARTPPPRAVRPYLSNRQRLLERCAKNNAMHREAQSRLQAHRASVIEREPETKNMVLRPSSSSSSKSFGESGSSPRPPDADIEKGDDIEAAEEEVEHKKSPTLASGGTADAATSSNPTAHAAPTPPAPPWPGQEEGRPEHGEAPLPQKPTPSKPHDMHLIMPPPPSNPFAAANTLQTPLSTSSTPNHVLGTGIAASPASLGPLTGNSLSNAPIFSPSVVAAVNPSPARKKLSLSDYTRRTKAKIEPESTKADRDSSPISATSTTVPALLATTSELGRVQNSGSAIAEEDVKMEDSVPAGVI